LSEFLIIPMNRLGVVGVQKNVMGVIKFINEAITRNKRVLWLMIDTQLYTTEFPEGHVYSKGSFILENGVEIKEQLENQNFTFSEIKGDIKNCKELSHKKIALYLGKGTAEFCWKPLIEVLDLAGFPYSPLYDSDIREGRLEHFDILIVPGGPDAGESYYFGMGKLGYDNLKDFIINRGNYFGICAGAYLPLTSLYSENRYWLNLIEATDDHDLDYWRTGTGFVRISITNPLHPFAFGLTSGGVNTLDCVYWEGPAIKVLKDNVKILAKFNEFIASGTTHDRPTWDLLDNYPAIDSINSWYNLLTKERFDKYLKGSAAIVETKINSNKVLLYSHHAEFGNIGIARRKDSMIFLLITNALFYLSI